MIFAQNDWVNSYFYEDFEKIFKPITKQQKTSSDEIVSKFTPLQEAMGSS